MPHLIRHPAKTKYRGFSNKFQTVFLDSLKPTINQIKYCYILSAFFCIVFSGCAFTALEKEVALFNQTSRLQGTLTNTSPHKKPLVVLVYQFQDNEKKLVTYSIHHTPRTFTFVQLPGRYLIAAFEDANEDFVYQPTEYAGYVGNPSIITIEPGKDILHLDLTLQHPDDVTLTEAPNLTSPATNMTLRFPKTRAGEIVTLEDPRFSRENGRVGLWEPIQFLRTVGGGVFFLEPFDSEKIPVLLVHGIGGYSEEMTSFIHQLDQTRFQPWIFNYPTGLRLDMATEFLRRSLSKILVKYKYNKLVIIAHSMGGLVARSLVNTSVCCIVHGFEEQQYKLLFITLSTPWGGHQAAQIGVDYAPAVIPSWLDMVPDSPFQRTLFQKPLPDYIEYYLFFSFQGGRNIFTNGNDDGSVSLASQLKPQAQDAAIRMFGFNENHTSILSSPHATAKIVGILTTFANRE